MISTRLDHVDDFLVFLLSYRFATDVQHLVAFFQRRVADGRLYIHRISIIYITDRGHTHTQL